MRLAAHLLTTLQSAVGAQTDPSATTPTTGVTFVCANLKGSYISAPDWTVEEDGSGDQLVLVSFNGEKPGKVTWFRDDKPYYESMGVGISMAGGFAILIPAEDRIETYVYSAGTTELFFSQIRSGNSILPNVVKAQRGTCKPAGVLAR